MKFEPLAQQFPMIDHLMNHKVTALFADPGTGKSSAVLHVISTLLLDGEIRGALIVAPLRVMLLTWPNELAKFEEFRWMKMMDLRTYEGRRAWHLGIAHIYLINYDMLVTFAKDLSRIKDKRKCPADMLVLDESQRVASGKKRVRAFRPFMPLFDRRVAMTGTPAPNSYLDLFHPVRLLDGGERFGTSFDQFRQRYFESDYNGWKWSIKPWAKKVIEEKIADITVTLRKEEWMHLPPTTVRDMMVHLPVEVQKKYRAFEKELLMQIKGREIVAINAAALITKLLQFTSGAIYDTEKVVTEVHDAKIEALKLIVKEADSPVLVAAHYKHEYDRIVKAIPGAELFREDRLGAWDRGEIPCWVAHSRSVGVGLNLQAGSCNVVWMSLTYSRTDYDQMNARLIRTGQERPTTIWRMLVPKTVDEAVVEALRFKGEEQDGLMAALRNLEKWSKKHSDRQ